MGASFPWIKVIAAGSSMVIALLLLAAILLQRNRRLSKRIAQISNTASGRLDLESPLAKMLDFLHRYHSSAWHVSLGPLHLSVGRGVPTADQAASLQDLIAGSFEHLNTPDFRKQMQDAGTYSNAIIRFLYHSTAGDNDESEVESLAASAEFQTLQSKRERAELEDSSGQWATPLFITPDLELTAVTIPPGLRGIIAHDYFLDFISPDAPARQCASPLAAVVKGAVEALELHKTALRSPGSVEALLNYALRIEQGYADEGYHCKLHAADVTNRVVSIIRACGLYSSDNAHDSQFVMAVLLAAAIHDYKHPQVNNQFLVTESAPVAVSFNDQSVTEMHSLREALSIITNDESINFQRGWKDRDFSLSVRKHVIQLVLATDMSRHFDIVAQFKALILQNDDLAKAPGRKWDIMNSKQKLITLQMALKVSDIGHCCLPWEQHQKWSLRLQEEFFKQGDMERKRGKKVSALMDRNKPGAADPGNQAGFYDVIVIPFLEAWTMAFPEVNALLHEAESNLAKWRALRDGELEIGMSSINPKTDCCNNRVVPISNCKS
mmetsp:Transcript_19716/g.47074  ORF Transcript_19716/g.47074 Transcript_19716/m.47074 type:complete len:551 (+) Transcript_19716:188-1840(+)